MFMGFANYYNRFIHNFATKAAPITSLLGKDVEFVWGERQQYSFEQLKRDLTSAPVLCLPDFERDFVVTCDASKFGIGATLSQPYDGVLKPVCYFSKKLSGAETRYSATDLEFMAILRACLKWRCYLQGQNVVIYTDHEPLKYLQT